MRKYHTLLVKFDSKDEPWSIQFGDYDRDCVVDERNDCYSECIATKIICTYEDQASVDAEVNRLNNKG